MSPMMRTRRLVVLLFAIALVLSDIPTADAARSRRRTKRRAPAKPPTISLVWHVEKLDGEVVETRRGEDAINPASVVKVATSLWALERLGPDFRFDTYFLARGSVEPETGELRGDLVVRGAGDLDFHGENAMLVAEALNRIGVSRVTGSLVVDPMFWMGWEGGSDRAQLDPRARGLAMAARLRSALDSSLWTAEQRKNWRRLAALRGFDPAQPPRVSIGGVLAMEASPPAGTLLVAHQSSPLIAVLRRFNCFSNNDIERLDATAGPPAALAPWLAMRVEAPLASVNLETSSGLGRNRLAPRTIVRLLREFRRSAETMGHPVESVLPVAGCEGCTVTRSYPRLSHGPTAAAIAAKTGTLTTTDGGIAVLAGFVSTAKGELAFCVAAPRSGRHLTHARRAMETWLLDLITRNGGPMPRSCGPALGGEGLDARIVALAPPAADTARARPAPPQPSGLAR